MVMDNVNSLVEGVLMVTMSPYQFIVHKQKIEIQKYKNKCSKKCNRNVDLINLKQIDEMLIKLNSHKLMFFLETSGSSALTIRQACAVESAAQHSGRKVILLMTSDTVNVCEEQVYSY